METPQAIWRRVGTAYREDVGAQHTGFTTGLGVLAATLGSAVGLGNIWKFPFLTGVNGGAAFIVVYLICTLLVGLPILIAEIALGRRARADAVSTLHVLAPRGQPWWLIGVAGVLGAFLVMAFYTVVAGWVFAYIFKAATGALLSTDPMVTTQAFARLVGDPFQSLIWQWVVLVFIGGITIFGVVGGIERATKRLMPLLFLLLVIISIRGLTLPGAVAGLEFLFRPDFTKVTGEMVLVAMGLAFFKLSIGIGAMMTYGSYFRPDQDIPLTATRVMFADLVVSLLAGIAIFPTVFAFGFKPDAGPSLLFITIPAVFAAMPLGQIFLFLFFVLAAVASTGAMLGLLEVPIAFLHRRMGLSRIQATIVTISLLAVVGSSAALSNNLLADVKPFGLTLFDLYDFISSNLLLPLSGLLISLFVGWVWSYAEIRQTLANEGALHNDVVVRIFYMVVKLITPVLVVIVLLKGLKLI